MSIKTNLTELWREIKFYIYLKIQINKMLKEVRECFVNDEK